MNAATIQAFFNELSSMEKKAGIVSNIGTKILRTAKAGVKAAPGWAKNEAQGSIRNLGNTVGAFATPGQSIANGWKATTKDFGKMSPAMKALMIGGVGLDAHEALAKKDPTGQNRGRVERVGASVGSQVGGLIGTPFGITGGVAGGLIGRKIGGTVGKLGDKARGYKKPKNSKPEGIVPNQVRIPHAALTGRG